MNACHLLAVQAMDLRMTRRQCIIIHIPHIAYIRSVLIQTIANTHRRYECIYICSVVYVMCTGCCCCVFLFLLLTILFGWVGLSSSLSPFGNAVCMFFFFFYLFSSIQYIRPFELCCVYATNTLPLKRSGLPTNAHTHTNSSSYIYNKIHSIRISRDNRILCERHPIQLVLPCSGWHIQYTQAVATTVASYWIMRRIIQLYVTYLMRA